MMKNRRHRRDLLSDLPVGLIENILVRLPISDAIRTSILSTNWRFRWTTIPHLVFDENHMDMLSGVEFASNAGFENRIKSYVTSTLFRHEGPLHKFKLTLHIPNCSEVHQWLLYLLRKDIKELILKMNESTVMMFDVPSSLFSFQSLTFLQLSYCRLRPLPPKFKGFLSLKSLVFQRVDGPAGTIQSVVAHSPLLETLKLRQCQFGPLTADFKGFLNLRSLILQFVDVPGTLIINAPKLKSLELIFYGPKKIHLCAPLLAKLTLIVDHLKDGRNKKSFHCNYTEFFGGLANLETLTGVGVGVGGLTKLFIIGNEHYKQPLVFHRLKTIKLDEVNFKSTGEILVAVRLILDASATLCELQLSNSFHDEEEEEEEEEKSKIPGVHSWDSICPQNCTFGKLKSVEVEHFRGGIQEMKFIKFVLASSPVLQQMTVNVAYCNKPTEKHLMNSTVQLLSYRRASSATILFKAFS